MAKHMNGNIWLEHLFFVRRGKRLKRKQPSKVKNLVLYRKMYVCLLLVLFFALTVECEKKRLVYEQTGERSEEKSAHACNFLHITYNIVERMTRGTSSIVHCRIHIIFIIIIFVVAVAVAAFIACSSVAANRFFCFPFFTLSFIHRIYLVNKSICLVFSSLACPQSYHLFDAIWCFIFISTVLGIQVELIIFHSLLLPS